MSKWKILNKLPKHSVKGQYKKNTQKARINGLSPPQKKKIKRRRRGKRKKGRKKNTSRWIICKKTNNYGIDAWEEK